MGRRVEIGDTMLQCIFHLLVDQILIYASVFLRQSHHSIAQQRNLIARLAVDAVRHVVRYDNSLFISAES